VKTLRTGERQEGSRFHCRRSAASPDQCGAAGRPMPLRAACGPNHKPREGLPGLGLLRLVSVAKAPRRRSSPSRIASARRIAHEREAVCGSSCRRYPGRCRARRLHRGRRVIHRLGVPGPGWLLRGRDAGSVFVLRAAPDRSVEPASPCTMPGPIPRPRAASCPSALCASCRDPCRRGRVPMNRGSRRGRDRPTANAHPPARMAAVTTAPTIRTFFFATLSMPGNSPRNERPDFTQVFQDQSFL
jgi:hypothetical protein